MNGRISISFVNLLRFLCSFDTPRRWRKAGTPRRAAPLQILPETVHRHGRYCTRADPRISRKLDAVGSLAQPDQRTLPQSARGTGGHRRTIQNGGPHVGSGVRSLSYLQGEVGREKVRQAGHPLYHIAQKARPPQPRLRYPQDPRSPGNRANAGRRYVKWKERLGIDHHATPQPQGVLAALAGPNAPKENLDRTERLLMVLLRADIAKVKAARKLRRKWPWHRSRLYEAETRRARRMGRRSNELPESNP
jgi:hypothetical protein